MTKVKTNGRWIIPSIDDVRSLLVRPEDQTTVHISPTCVCTRYAFRGVPARAVDVLVDRRIEKHSADGRGHWPKGKRRAECDATEFMRRLLDGHTAVDISRRTGIDRTTISRWKTGKVKPTLAMIERVIDAILPANRGWVPIYRNDMAIDGNTRVVGVGEYSIRAAR